MQVTATSLNCTIRDNVMTGGLQVRETLVRNVDFTQYSRNSVRVCVVIIFMEFH